MNTQSDKNQKSKFITVFLVMFFILVGGGLQGATHFGDEVVAPVLMFFFALCFIVFAIWSKKNWWAIIPGGIFASVGLVVVLEDLIPDSEMEAPAMMFLFVLCFIVFAIRSKKNWWAIIPGGIFASVGLVVVLEDLIPHEEFPSLPFTIHWGFYSWVLFLGLAVTFGVLWLLRKTLPTDWAKYPATGLGVIAVQCFVLGSRFQETCMISFLVAIGAMLMLALFTRKHLPVAGGDG